MGKYIINIIVKIMERNQSTYQPCKMYMLTGNCLNKCECPYNHLAPKVHGEKKKLQLRVSEPFSLDFHPTGSQKNVEKTETIITEKKPEPEAFKPTPQAQNKPAQPRQNQNPQGFVNNNNQIDLSQLDPKTRQEIMQNMQMQQYQQMLMMQQLQQQNQFKGNNFGMNMQQNMMNQFGAMNMGQFGG